MSQILIYNALLLKPSIKQQIEEVASLNNHTIYNDYVASRIHHIKFQLERRGSNWYDRTQHYQHFLNIKHIPLPKLDNFSKNFEDVVSERAKYLVKQNKSINLLWSGGIDSTLAFAALEREISNPDQLKITCTYNSIFESGSFFDKHIKNKFEYDIGVRQLTTQPYNFKFDSDIVLSGQLGDHLMGHYNSDDCLYSNAFFTRKDKKNPSKEQVIDEMDSKVQDVLSEEYYNFYLPIMKRAGVVVENMKDFLWFCFFVCAWTTGTHRLKMIQSLKHMSCFDAFFDTEDFQKWSMLHKGGKYHPLHPDWKTEFKQIIGDVGYMKKTKCNSSLLFGPALKIYKVNSVLCVMEDGTNYIHKNGNINAIKY